MSGRIPTPAAIQPSPIAATQPPKTQPSAPAYAKPPGADHIQRVLPGNEVQFFVGAEQTSAAIAHDISQARGTVNMEMYAWQNNGTGKVLADAMKGAAARGNEINVVVDRFGMRGFGRNGREFAEDLRTSGINLSIHDNIQVPTGGRTLFNGAEHRKLFLMNVDGKPVAWVGGMNFAEQYDNWHDGMVRIEGPAVGPLAAMFAGRWRATGQAVSEGHKQLIAEAHARGPIEGAKAGVAVIANTPRSGPESLQLTRHFFAEAASSKERFWFQNPLLTSPEMVRQVIHAAEQPTEGGGRKDVRLIVPGPDGALNKMTYTMQRAHYPSLLKAGVRIFELPQMTHFKLALADDRPSVTSLNIADRSFHKDFELGAAILGDKKFLGEVESLMQADMARSRELTLDDVDGLSYKVLAGAQRVFGFKV